MSDTDNHAPDPSPYRPPVYRPPSPTDPLADTRPFTLAAAFLHYHDYAVVDDYTDGCGKQQFKAPVPKRLRHWREDFYEFNGSIYERLNAENLRADLNAFLNQQTYFGRDNSVLPLRVNEALKRDVLGQVRDICQARVELMPSWLGGRDLPHPRDVIAFRNGLLDIQTWLRDPDIPVMPPTDAWFSVNSLGCDYDPRAVAPRWLRFLSECLLDKPDLIALLQEWCGYCLTSDTSRQRLLWLHGPSGAGKSTFATVLQRLLGARSVVRFDLWDLAQPFGLSPFLGKRVAISADAHLGHSSEAEKVLAKLKQISGDDETSVNRKNREILESIKLTTRFIILTNEFPLLSDASDALVRRAMFVPFERTPGGTSGANGTSPPNNDDTSLGDRLAQELPGIAVWALRGLARLIARGFTTADSGYEIRDQFRRLQSPVLAFVQDWCERPGDPGYEGDKAESFWADKGELYRAFRRWCKLQEIRAISMDRFSTKLYRAAPTVRSARPRTPTSRQNLFIGIRLMPEYVEHNSSYGETPE